jgi:hypothetical protein
MNEEVTQEAEEKRDLIRLFYDKQQSINQQQEELYFLAKQYYSEKYPKLNKGNYYAKEYYGNIEFLYQPNDGRINRVSRTYSIEEWNNSIYDLGDNLIENHFYYSIYADKIKTKGITDRYDSLYLYSQSEKYYLLFNDSNKDDVFKEYGFKNAIINRVNLLKLYNKMKTQSDLERVL